MPAALQSRGSAAGVRPVTRDNERFEAPRGPQAVDRGPPEGGHLRLWNFLLAKKKIEVPISNITLKLVEFEKK
jgi:hypothetical protein